MSEVLKELLIAVGAFIAGWVCDRLVMRSRAR